ncbi:UDP-N-acetylglucosamine 2-epimerase [Aestuariibacter halophilus]|uniref:UDP-N-acetylglucosamine 2-epimerase n=1 Tax=Fluctibacter halophilus TaxID=226011 RepID=A0ABS8G4S8_9ALTE|nr:UDP-N-acetylglucosamine 2-epimerase [Aestuariibacter halophilus]MCC2615126.1 UDP-N-acetylglucosamine 2-epimerase [Aestuariibacter halophilus]
MHDTKKILAVTGIRSEYDILFPVIDGLRQSPDFDVEVVVCGAHLSAQHGDTQTKILEDGFVIADRIDSLYATERLTQRPKGISALISGLSQTVERVKPDFLLVVGDREESIATALVGNYMDVLVAHIGGGDPVFGNADDPVRMAVSKLAHIHFATAEPYAENLHRLGEEAHRICFSGTPGLDNIVNEPHIGLDKVSDFIGTALHDYVVVLKHPLSSEQADAAAQMRVTLQAVSSFCQQHHFKAVVIQSNSDPGANAMAEVTQSFRSDACVFCHTLPREIFVNLMRHAKVLIGNSSMGILEAPTYGLPVVNVGHRQQGRLNAGNVEFVEYDVGLIQSAIQKAALDGAYRETIKQIRSPYGDGHAAQRIVDFLSAIERKDFAKWHMKRQLVG